MNDRYLFRAKRIDNGEWVEGCLLVLDDETYRIATSCLQGIAEQLLEVCAYEVDPPTICQCTGLKDKNGNMIWENDVVKGAWFDKGKRHRHIGTVSYTCFAYKVVGVKQYYGLHDELNGIYTVIGNIFDNPELINESEIRL